MEKKNKPQDKQQPTYQRGNPLPGDDIPKAPIGDEVTHPPVIVTGESSTAVDFERSAYTEGVPGTHTSTNLFLNSVEINRLDGSGHHICHTLADGEVCFVEVECKIPGQTDKNITVLGGKPLSPTIKFDPQEYKEVNAAGKRRKHSNANRKIQGLKIYRVVGGVKEPNPFHECDLVPANGKCVITIADFHIHPH